MATKLKNMRLTSVDLVRNGANQEADICLFKSADPAEAPTEQETNIFKRFLNWLRENPAEGENEPENPIEKADEQPDLVDVYKSAITESLQSIAADESLSAAEKNDMIAKSLSEYHDAMVELLIFGETEDGLAKSDEDEDEVEWDEDAEDEVEEDDEEVGKSADFDEIEEVETVEKFNPYHDSRGRFSSASGGGKFFATPGKSRAHDMAIARQKERQEAGGATGGKKPSDDGKPKYDPAKYQEIKRLKPPTYKQGIRVTNGDYEGVVSRVKPGYKRADHANDFMYSVSINNTKTGENVFRTNRYGSTASSAFHDVKRDLWLHLTPMRTPVAGDPG